MPPFQNHLFADPAGSFTTGPRWWPAWRAPCARPPARTLAGKRVAIYGGTGVVAYCAAVLCAQAGARPALVGYNGASGWRRSPSA